MNASIKNKSAAELERLATTLLAMRQADLTRAETLNAAVLCVVNGSPRASVTCEDVSAQSSASQLNGVASRAQSVLNVDLSRT